MVRFSRLTASRLVHRPLAILVAGALFASVTALAFAQQRTTQPTQPTAPARGAGARGARGGAAEGEAGQRGQARGERQQRGPLGGIPLSEEDNAVKPLISRLDFERYKRLIGGLAAFGERRQGTEKNVEAMNWIEKQLAGWGYKVEHLKYEYRGEPRDQVYATKIGSTSPGEMYIISGHMDGIGGGDAAGDDGSGSALVLEIARVLSRPEVKTARSVRFCLWNNEETGLNGARAYVEARLQMQGVEEPAGSGLYPEPKWLGIIQHDMMLFDHGNPVQPEQVRNADVDVEFQLNSTKAFESSLLGLALLNSNRKFASDYPATLSNSMSNTDSVPFQNHTAAVSMRENRRLYEIGRGSNPNWHKPTDVMATYTDADFKLGFNACQTTLGAIATLAEAEVAGAQGPEADKE